MTHTAFFDYGPHAIRRGEEPIFLDIETQPAGKSKCTGGK